MNSIQFKAVLTKEAGGLRDTMGVRKQLVSVHLEESVSAVCQCAENGAGGRLLLALLLLLLVTLTFQKKMNSEDLAKSNFGLAWPSPLSAQ